MKEGREGNLKKTSRRNNEEKSTPRCDEAAPLGEYLKEANGHKLVMPPPRAPKKEGGFFEKRKQVPPGEQQPQGGKRERRPGGVRTPEEGQTIPYPRAQIKRGHTQCRPRGAKSGDSVKKEKKLRKTPAVSNGCFGERRGRGRWGTGEI